MGDEADLQDTVRVRLPSNLECRNQCILRVKSRTLKRSIRKASMQDHTCFQWTYTATYGCGDNPITDCKYRQPEIFRACSDIQILKDYDDGLCPRGFQDGGEGFNCYHITKDRTLTYEMAKEVSHKERMVAGLNTFIFKKI